MLLPVVIEYHNIQSSPAVDALVHARAEKLLHYSSRLQHCHVFLEQPPRHQHHGSSYQVHLKLAVPGATLTVSRDESGHPDLYAAVRNAFDRAERQVGDWAKKSRRGAAA